MQADIAPIPVFRQVAHSIQPEWATKPSIIISNQEIEDLINQFSSTSIEIQFLDLGVD